MPVPSRTSNEISFAQQNSKRESARIARQLRNRSGSRHNPSTTNCRTRALQPDEILRNSRANISPAFLPPVYLTWRVIGSSRPAVHDAREPCRRIRWLSCLRLERFRRPGSADPQRRSQKPAGGAGKCCPFHKVVPGDSGTEQQAGYYCCGQRAERQELCCPVH